MALTTRTKITSLFALIVSILIVLLNVLIFESSNAEWQNKKNEYMHSSMEAPATMEEAKREFPNLQIVNGSGDIIYEQGIFTHDMKHESLASWFFDDPLITIANGRAYYWGIMSKRDGYTYKTVDDVSDIIYARDMLIERALWLSVGGLVLIFIIGYNFSGYILRPIHNMNEATRKFSLSEKDNSPHVGIYGNIKDEVVILARSLESLFLRVNKEAERLEQFSDDIAHEIKNKLFEILSSLDIASTPEYREVGIQKAKKILKQVSHVVDALLFFARNHNGVPESKNIGTFLKQSLDLDDKRIVLDFIENPKVAIFPELFLTAVGNIISNAQKFTDDSGKITLTLTQSSLQIVDTGIGIKSEHLPFIFDRLYKVDGARTPGSGQGLGLSITKKIIEELHGFSLSVASTYGNGTHFIIDWTEA